ncbi:Nuclease domain-containing protein 1 [Armadillidium nasatum]|uniref:Staphylococcal nuclease domain-containing protein 1 n=1 Tax=Armadillidium nasatum TaxID=96803 RepID=A0A5N5SXB7_9CRUS|nr:Nuclease domain-containing protein 1 [Armadillidium nasatum]
MQKRQNSTEVDEPCGWQAREFLRTLVIGKEVLFSIETKTATGREYGTIYVGKDVNNLTNVTELMISEGLLTVRRESIRGNESHLTELEDAAKAAGKGKWSPDAHKNVRDIKWSVEDVRAFVDKHKGKPMKAIIEHVRDGSSVKAFLLPDFYNITLMISGIKNGNIAELLLREGYAKCQTWSMKSVTGGSNKLQEAEKIAMNKKLRVWAGYTPPASQGLWFGGLKAKDGGSLVQKESEFNGKVAEIINGESLIIKKNNGQQKKIFLSSIRQPRSDQPDTRQSASVRNRPLYDTPFLYEAREFLRKKLIGQKVHVSVDYIQPPQNNFPEKVCATVRIGDVNVAQALVSKGLATVVRYRQDDDNRSSCYDELLSAEAKAIKEAVGLHSKKDIPIHRIQDVSGDPTKAKAFYPFLSRVGKTDAVVEYVNWGSRIRLYIPKETCLITFLLAGISCPRPSRSTPGNPGNIIPGDEFGTEALEYTKNSILQREVEIEVEGMDKGGNFIGWLFFDNQNLSVKLVENGLSSVHSTAEGSKFSQALTSAEQNAKKKKLNMWANYVEQEKEKTEETTTERRIDPKSMMISEVTREGRVYAQYCSDGPALESMMDNLRQEFEARPPVTGAFTPKRGALCSSKFVDGAWYRAKVEKVSNGQVTVYYIDYGNREVTTTTNLAALPPQFGSAQPYAHEFALALVKFPKDVSNRLKVFIHSLLFVKFSHRLVRHYFYDFVNLVNIIVLKDIVADAVEFLISETIDKEIKVNREYKANGLEFVTLQRVNDKVDLGRLLLSQGFLMVDNRKEKRMQSLLIDYRNAQDEAKKKRLNLWRYGDATEDDAYEFGMEK